jgi:twitching motility protein PilT
MDELGASDIHLYPGAPPVFRIDNQTCPTGRFAPVSEQQIERLIHELAPDAAWEEFQKEQQCSFNYRQVDMAHSRVSAFIKSGVPHCTIRYLPERIPTFEDLHIPRKIMESLAELNEGLVLVSGMTGSGKSTTVASLIDWINENNSLHILTIESPVEYVHVNKQSIISQRNVGTDAPTAIKAVHGALRHDPDVIFIGEMRDSDTIRAAIDAASTGHLVISTFHANTAAEVMNRIVSFFDPVERDLVRLQLRDCIRCVMCQRLVPKRGGGRVPALEFLFADTNHILECIINGNTSGLRVAMQQTTSQSAIFEQSLINLVREGLVLDAVAAQYASNRDLFEQIRLGTYAVPSVDSMLHRHGS